MKVEEPALQYYSRYTFDDWVNWEGRWELIDGAPYAMSPLPTSEHQRINYRIISEFEKAMKPCKDCEVYLPVNWRISNDTIVHPDVSVVCPAFTGLYLNYSPKIIFEILSPSTAFKDRNKKMKLYAEQGVNYYVLVDGDSKTAEIYQLRKNEYFKISTVSMEKFIFEINDCKINFSFSKIWL